jgi:glutathione synthase/RimK-type ligase-like ATP-grasp enzyme
MKKIGILYGMEQSFPESLIAYINSKNIKDISADMIKIGTVSMESVYDYNVILDRVSQEVQYYRSILKHITLKGTHVINNPFWASADDNFFHASLAVKTGINVPKTVILPSKEHPHGVTSDTLKNLEYPLNWHAVFDYVGFPAYIKPNISSNVDTDFKVYNPQEFFSAYDLTGSSVMLLQESIEFQEYYRCYVIGRNHTRIMSYDPTKPFHLRYSQKEPKIDPKLKEEIERISIKICTALGFDFNAIEYAVRDGIPYAIDFLQQIPLARRSYLHEENFEWLVKTAGDFLIELALEGKYHSSEFTWSAFLKGPKSPVKRIKKPFNKKKKSE